MTLEQSHLEGHFHIYKDSGKMHWSLLTYAMCLLYAFGFILARGVGGTCVVVVVVVVVLAADTHACTAKRKAIAQPPPCA